jgi:4-amino-4-deoxy-L-arabinose transferase-like glycosyltransferase
MTRRAEGAGHGRALGMIVLAAVVLRLAFSLGYWHDKPLTHDEQEYLVLAMNMAADRGFSAALPGALEGPNVQHFSRAPLYPWMLSLILRATGHQTDILPVAVPTAIKVVQSLAGAATVWTVAALARQAGGVGPSLVAAGLAAIYPPLVWIGAFALSEAIYTPLVLASLWMLGAPRQGTTADGEELSRSASPTPHRAAALTVARAALGGALLGGAALIRPGTLAFVPFLAAWLLTRARWTTMLVALVATLVPIVPWTVRNYVTHGRVILIAAEGGVTFWTGNHPEATGEGDLAANPHLKTRQQELLARHPGLAPEAMEPVYYGEALAFVRTQPLRWLALCTRKLFFTFAPWGPSYRLHSALYFWGSVIPYAAVFVLSILAWTRLGAAGWPPGPLVAAATATVATNLVFFPQERFRIPILDPTYIVSAALWLSACWRVPGSALTGRCGGH